MFQSSGRQNPQAQAKRKLFEPDAMDEMMIVSEGEHSQLFDTESQQLDEELLTCPESVPVEAAPEDVNRDFQEAPAVLQDESINVAKRRKRNNVPGDEPRARKRTRNPSKWKANVSKTAKNAGMPYKTKKGDFVPGKAMGPPCEDSCKFQCCKEITQENRMAIFNLFWKTTDTHDKKWHFITRLVTNKAPERPAIDTISGKNRTNTRNYFLRINNEMKRVCKTMFLSTLAIS